jgi:hypothetical protein
LGWGRIPTVRGGRIRQAEADAGERDGRLTTDELEEPAQLRREMSRPCRVNEAPAHPPKGAPRIHIRPWGPAEWQD